MTAPADLNLDECRRICHGLGQHARSFVDTANEGSEAHGIAVIAQRKVYDLICEVERLRDENDKLTEVYVTGARMRTFPVSLEDHMALVDAIDACRTVLEADDDA